jgi:hypothetical protein
MSFLDSFLNPYSKDPTFIDGMRISVMKSTNFLSFTPSGRSIECPSGNLIRPSFTRKSKSLSALVTSKS